MPNNEKPNKQSLFTFEINIPVVFAVFCLLYLGYSGHQENMKNSQKINQLLLKYEKTLDTAIASDKKSLSNYRKNIENVLADLSPEEKRLLEATLSLSKGGNTPK
ncbi:hypothetical protein [Parashewanella tropica]|uniref:hypothetical protein n=1 Tax=Parashewanella tropica TaxID=2547970 RepID=UPI001059DBD4|nr:hypothetical protein [Parashewanella tropica]